MNAVENIIQSLYDKGIEVIAKALPGTLKASCLSFCMSKNKCRPERLKTAKFILCDESKILDNKEMYFEIAHEEMHLENPDTMYRLDEPYKIIKRKEYKCRRLMARKYVPKEKLFKLLYIDHLDLYEIADRLCLSEDLVLEAYNYYSGLESWIKDEERYERGE